LARERFSARFLASYKNPAFRAEEPSISRLEEIAWQVYTKGRKAPFMQKAGKDYANPDYELSDEWVATKKCIDAAQLQWLDPASRSRVLLVYGLVVHGDVAGIDGSRRKLSDWLDWMGFIDAGFQSRLDRYIGYYEPSATSHVALDKDTAF
jgi:hypothetical protein